MYLRFAEMPRVPSVLVAQQCPKIDFLAQTSALSTDHAHSIISHGPSPIYLRRNHELWPFGFPRDIACLCQFHHFLNSSDRLSLPAPKTEVSPIYYSSYVRIPSSPQASRRQVTGYYDGVQHMITYRATYIRSAASGSGALPHPRTAVSPNPALNR
jgi:hypothetical protein